MESPTNSTSFPPSVSPTSPTNPNTFNHSVPPPPTDFNNFTLPSPLSPTEGDTIPSDTNWSTPAYAPSGGEGGLPPAVLAAIVIGLVILGVGVVVLLYFYMKKKRKLAARDLPLHAPKNDPFAGPLESGQQNAPPPTAYNRPVPPNGIAPPGIAANSSISSPSLGHPIGNLQSSFTYEELKMATDNFSEANLLGQGGFGYVHKGILPNGKVVAIKQLKTGSSQGEREFQAEVDIIGRVHHRHLVSLVGYCMSEEHRMLVYEFVPNKTLEFHLHGKGRSVMSWPIRMKIALGSARGLAYLHEDCHPKIIHRDIKVANILIDENFEAKVADFGLAKFSLDTDTHVSTRVMGTFGYLAPEYASSGKLTEKSDTFSFGVLLLELITGRRPFHRNNRNLDDSLVDWARPLLTQALEDGNFYAFVDPNLEEYDSSEMKRIVACVAACVRYSARLRPQMSQIVRALEGIIPLEDLNEGVKPGQSRTFGYGNSEYGSSQYKDDMKNFRKLALESEEHGSSAFTSEGGQTFSTSSTEDLRTTQEM